MNEDDYSEYLKYRRKIEIEGSNNKEMNPVDSIKQIIQFGAVSTKYSNRKLFQ